MDCLWRERTFWTWNIFYHILPTFFLCVCRVMPKWMGINGIRAPQGKAECRPDSRNAHLWGVCTSFKKIIDNFFLFTFNNPFKFWLLAGTCWNFLTIFEFFFLIKKIWWIIKVNFFHESPLVILKSYFSGKKNGWQSTVRKAIMVWNNAWKCPNGT
jgi:hypothetical protein